MLNVDKQVERHIENVKSGVGYFEVKTVFNGEFAESLEKFM